MKFLIVIAFLFATASALSQFEHFQQFQQKFNKTYATPEEFNIRFKIFQSNLVKVDQMNNGKTSPVYGVTKFMDLTPEEFKDLYLMKKPVTNNEPKKVGHPGNLKAPSQFDWRSKGAVTPVYNQGQCGSCWAFSITENIESMWFLAGHPLTRLSMEQVKDCDYSDDGCDGGNPPTAYQYVESAGGLMSYSDDPYVATDEPCSFKSSEIVASISNWEYATQDEDEDQMATYLYNHGPLSICVDASSWQYYSGGIITVDDGCGQSLDHCVMATGYDNSGSTPYWIVRNSWGTDWGYDGYLYVQKGQNVCGIADEATSSVI